jgi:DNA-binding sugar fermentation-stimulating protein
MSQQFLLKLNDLIEGVVIKRPSQYIKTPYVSDIMINNSENVIAHSASLGCCGLADTHAKVMIQKMKTKKNKDNKLHCSHSVYLSIYKELDKNREQIVGIHPKLAEKIVENALKQNLLSKLKYVKKYKKEVAMFVQNRVDSRFDFAGIDANEIPFIMEVKNVPLADYEDTTEKERKKMNFYDRDFDSKVAYFPDGYRKKSTDTVSPRALKHIRELTHIKENSKTRCIMCYVIQRNDVNRFQVSVIDPEYRQAVKDAINKGVEIITLVVSWTREGECYFVRDDLPVTTFE